MGGIGAWLGRLAWPLVSKVLASLGLGVVSYVGLNAALGAMLGAAKGALGGMSGDMVQLLAMAGMFQALSIIAGGLLASVAFIALKKLSVVTGS